MPYNRKSYYSVDNVTNNIAQYKFQNYNSSIVTFLDRHKNASPSWKLAVTTVQHSKIIRLYSSQVTTFCFKFLTVYSAKHDEHQLVAKSTVPCFLTRVIFIMSIFSTVVCPRCAPGIGGMGGTTQIGGTLNKIFRREAPPPPSISKPCLRLWCSSMTGPVRQWRKKKIWL